MCALITLQLSRPCQQVFRGQTGRKLGTEATGGGVHNFHEGIKNRERACWPSVTFLLLQCAYPVGSRMLVCQREVCLKLRTFLNWLLKESYRLCACKLTAAQQLEIHLFFFSHVLHGECFKGLLSDKRRANPLAVESATMSLAEGCLSTE